jgi:hypothetical protein
MRRNPSASSAAGRIKPDHIKENRMNAKPLGLLVVVTLFGVFGTSAATAQAVHEGEVFTDAFDVTLPAEFLPCLQEDVHVTGTIRTSRKSTTDGSGGGHITNHQFTDLIGVGVESGLTYRVTGPFSFTLYTSDDEIERALHLHNVILHVVGPGGAANMLLLQTYNVTTNANGETKVERIVEFEMRCPAA